MNTIDMIIFVLMVIGIPIAVFYLYRLITLPIRILEQLNESRKDKKDKDKDKKDE